jgi:hypothetical protein
VKLTDLWWPTAYGVAVFADEDDWGWWIFSHEHSNHRILAAISKDARENGADTDLRDAIDGDTSSFVITKVWINNVRETGDGYTWDDCKPTDLDAEPMTRVTI